MSDAEFTIGGDNSQFLTAIKESQDTVAQASSAIRSSLQQMTGHFGKVTESAVDVGEALGDIKEKFATAFEITGIAAAVEGFNKIREAIEEVAQRVKTISTDSQALGVSVEQFQAMQEAAEEAGVGTEVLAHAGERLAAVLLQARQGSSEAIDKLLTLGITTKQVNDPTFALNDLLQILHDRLNDASTEHQTMNALVAELGTRAAAAAVALKLYEGSQEAVNRTISNSNGLNKEQVKSLQETVSAWDKLGTAVENTKAKMLLAANVAYQVKKGGRSEADLEAPDPDSLWMGRQGQQQAQDASTNDSASAATEHGAAQRIESEEKGSQEWGIIQQEMMQQELANIQVGVAATKEGTAARLQLLREYADEAAQLYGTDSAKAIQAQTKLIAEQRSYNETQKQGIQELTTFTDDLENQAHALHDKLALDEAKKDLQKTRQQEKDMQELSDFAIDLDTRVTEEHAKLQQRLAQINLKIRADFISKWKGIGDAMSGSISGALTGMLTRSETVKQGIQSIFQSLAGSIIKHFVDIGVQWAETQLANLILGQTTAKAQGIALAGQAGAAGVASFAGAPWPIDILAPAFGAEMFASAMSYASAAGGYDIPSGVNPMTQLHEREMVLPANLADTVRDMAAGGGAGSQEHHYYNGDVTVNHDEQLRRVLSNSAAQRRLVKTIAAGYRHGARR